MSTVDANVETPGAPLQESDPPAGHSELASARLARVGDVEVRRLLGCAAAAAWAPGVSWITTARCRWTAWPGCRSRRTLMWWNFVGRTPEDIIDAAQAWAAESGRIGEVRGYRGRPWPLPRSTRSAWPAALR